MSSTTGKLTSVCGPRSGRALVGLRQPEADLAKGTAAGARAPHSGVRQMPGPGPAQDNAFPDAAELPQVPASVSMPGVNEAIVPGLRWSPGRGLTGRSSYRPALASACL